MDAEKKNTDIIKQGTQKKSQYVTIEEKIDAVKRLNRGEDIKRIGSELGVHETTLRRWKKKEKKMLDFIQHGHQKDIKTMRMAHNPLLEEALKIWFDNRRKRGIPLTGPLIQAKALTLNEKLGGDGKFQASEGWLSRWRTRYKIKSFTAEEKSLVDPLAAQDFKKKFAELVKNEDLTPSQIFNCDETGLNYKMLPKKALAKENRGYKFNKERVTVMPCTNADGSLKLPLLVIGKSEKPRALRDSSPESLPVIYTCQKRAWMNSSIFEDWFRGVFVPRVRSFLMSRRLLPKAVLLINNGGAHPRELVEDGIRVIFMPPNVTGIIQPLNGGIIENFKKNYHLKFLLAIFSARESGKELFEQLDGVMMRDVMLWCAKAWDDISQATIAKAWKTLIPEKLDNELQGNAGDQHGKFIQFLGIFSRLSGSDVVDEEEVREWISGADAAEANDINDEEIIDMVQPGEQILSQCGEAPSGDSGEENSIDPLLNTSRVKAEKIDVISPSEAVGAADSLMEFFRHYGSLSAEETAALAKIRQKAWIIKFDDNNM